MFQKCILGEGGSKEKYEVTVFTENIVREPDEQKVGKGKDEEKLKITIDKNVPKQNNPYEVLVRELTAVGKVYHGKTIYEMRTASLKTFNPKKDIVITKTTTATAFHSESSRRIGANPIKTYVILGVKVPIYKLAKATATSEYEMTQLGNESILLRQPLDDFHNIWSKVQKLVDKKYKGLHKMILKG
ncbi:hypothetical protein DdX_16895 [Ditylenchus destructor]|uniref:Uncharacterized protein n=1 Tax=Ditylenchus destructor TaxID=166010 RepID=A0AAD4MN95_9BILA|nr:hypothetical protein DdX_16895 [Ditylenchus destructor]